MRAKALALLFSASFAFCAPQAEAAAAPVKTALFNAVFVNSSPTPESPAEARRLKRLDRDLKAALEKSGQYKIVDLAPIQKKIDDVEDIHDCNGCEIDLAKAVGAKLAAVAWVQKISDLILNINIRIENVATGRFVKGGSVSIRGNTDVSWNRGLKYLLDEHIFSNRP